jgi:hypothetical protein
MNTITKGLGALALAATLLSAKPAFATSDWCYSDLWISCTTMEVPANASGHFIYIKISPYTSYRLKDANNGVVVSMGDIGSWIHSEVVWGLYGWYTLTIKGAASTGYINNT